MSIEKILVADDEEALRMLICDTLEKENRIIAEARDGTEACQLMLKEKYDLLILDVMMPERTGYELCQEAKKMDNSPLVLILTAKAQSTDREKALAAGADHVMIKPFSTVALEEIVDELLESRS